MVSALSEGGGSMLSVLGRRATRPCEVAIVLSVLLLLFMAFNSVLQSAEGKGPVEVGNYAAPVTAWACPGSWPDEYYAETC